MLVGFVGLGNMGRGMASNLLQAGHQVTVFNRSPGKSEALVGQGATLAGKVADACRGDAVITMLADDSALEDVVFSKDGILSSLPKGAIHISSSTISVALSRRLTESHAGAGQRFVAAPVFGRPNAAAARQLYIAAAGPGPAVRDAMPLLEAMSQRTYVLSDTPCQANLAKLSGNFLIASVIESLGEALALVGKAGVDRKQFVELLTSSLFNAPVYKVYGALLADDAPAPVGFSAPLGLKDIKLALAAGDELRVPMPLASLLRDRFLSLLAQQGEELDWSAIGKLAMRDAGRI